MKNERIKQGRFVDGACPDCGHTNLFEEPEGGGHKYWNCHNCDTSFDDMALTELQKTMLRRGLNCKPLDPINQFDGLLGWALRTCAKLIYDSPNISSS